MKSTNICVVLVNTKDDINIGNAVRACKNFGVFDLRLVKPRKADIERIKISAPKAQDVIDAIQIFPDLESAGADRDLVVGMTARSRYAERESLTPRVAAIQSGGQQTAFVFGREDRGLTNAELDRCDVLVKIPTNPDYTSLNLGQAVLLQVWECFQTGNTIDEAEKPREIIEKARMEKLFQQVDRSLDKIDFYKYGDGEHILRGLRILFNRSKMSEREFAVMFGVFAEVEKQFIRLEKKNE